ncbi:hypothetical protein [Microbacterium laevaniformans]|uniref:hypothetical protein n=1 Tax=Microbacterium laevaniformans TaxID=36807 RepID=UPI00362DB084
MTSFRSDIARYARTPFWDYLALSPLAKRILIILVAVTLILDSLFRATNGGSTSVVSAVVTTTMTLSVALFVWRPPIGTTVLIVTAAAASVTGGC